MGCEVRSADSLRSVPGGDRRVAARRDGGRLGRTCDTAAIRFRDQSMAADLINLSAGGAMVRANAALRVSDAVALALSDGRDFDCTVRWVRSDRFGLEFHADRDRPVDRSPWPEASVGDVKRALGGSPRH